MKKLIVFLISVFLISIILSCKGETGDKGAQGPTGPAGEDGYLVMQFQHEVYPSDAYTGCQDTYLLSSNQDTKYGSENVTVVGTAPSAKGRTVIKFDLSSIVPTNITVKRAYLTLKKESILGANTITAYALTKAFVETEATWNNRTNSSTWTTPGGDGDYNTTPMSNSIYFTTSTTEFVFTLDPVIVQSWINNSATNYGILIKADDEGMSSNNLVRFYTSDITNTSLRPILTIYYTLP